MKILLLLALVFSISGVLLLYLNYRITKKNNAEIYNNIKKLDDADKL